MFKRTHVVTALTCGLISAGSYALPIDWHGSLGYQSSIIDNYRKIEQQAEVNPIGTDAGSQEINLASGNHANASFQGYFFHLNPTIIVNDASTIKMEFGTGNGRGGFMGDSSNISDNTTTNNSMGNALYQHNTDSGNELMFSELHMELYADTATYVIGRHSHHWGMGALYNAGKNPWDHYKSIRDGLTMKVSVGSFTIAPYWGKINTGTGSSLTRSTRTKEYGFSLLYDNPDRELVFGLLYGKKKSSNTAKSFSTNITGTQQNLGQTDVKITDIYLKKRFGDLEFAFEVPLMGGEVGYVYNTTSQTKFKAKAFLFESTYDLTESWKIGIDAGNVSGDSGGTSSFDAMYLNPNYQIANLMFRYDFRAIGDSSYNIYNAYITNASYLKFRAHYETDQWTWKTAFIYAKANEVAEQGKQAYNHLNNRTFTAAANQKDDLGMEVDLGFDYHWNSELTINGDFGYHMVGDYYTFNNTTTTNTADNSFIVQLGATIDF